MLKKMLLCSKKLNLEIRYKGSKTAEPQFQATATPMFKNMMSGKS